MATFVGSYENERYFEFIRELAYSDDVGNIGEPTSPGFARVFKCSDTNRDGVDRGTLQGYAGTLNARPLTPEKLRVFAEYFWQFSYFPHSRKKVIDSYPSIDSGPGQTLLLALASRQGTGRCDLVEVARWQFLADPASGRLEQAFEVVHRFEARLSNGAAIVCD